MSSDADSAPPTPDERGAAPGPAVDTTNGDATDRAAEFAAGLAPVERGGPPDAPVASGGAAPATGDGAPNAGGDGAAGAGSFAPSAWPERAARRPSGRVTRPITRPVTRPVPASAATRAPAAAAVPAAEPALSEAEGSSRWTRLGVGMSASFVLATAALLALGISFALGVIFSPEVRGVFADEEPARPGGWRAEEDGREAPGESAVLVEVETLATGPMIAYYEQTTHLVAENRIDVLAEVSGVVSSIAVAEGAVVRAGMPLVELDRAQFELARRRASLALAEAENRARSALLRWNEALKDSEDKLAIRRGNADLVSAAELQQLQTAADTARLEYENAQSARDRAQADLDGAQLDVDRASVKSPIDGLIAVRHVAPGKLVNRNEAVFTVVDARSLQVELRVSERMLDRLKPGQAAWLVPYDDRSRRFRGAITAISPVVDVAQGTTAKVTIRSTQLTALVEAVFSAGAAVVDLPVKVGQFMLVQVESDRVADALRLPKVARVYEQREPFCFRLRDERAQRVSLRGREGIEDAEFLEVRGGALAAGDRVIVVGQHNLRDGARLRLAADQPAQPEAPAGRRGRE